MGGQDPYSSSKACAELVISAYRDSFFSLEDCQHHGVALGSARAGNVIGGADWAEDRLVPDIMRAFIEDRAVVIRNPNAVRPWQHVLEPLNGYLCLAEKLWERGQDFAQGWNFGPSDADVKPVSWVVEKLTRLWGENARWVLDAGQHPHEATVLKLDCSKANYLLGWSPKLDLSTALEWVVEWYRGYQHNENMRDLTEAQIARFSTTEAL
jgi:CDP-glucose 4,6-dehydratase